MALLLHILASRGVVVILIDVELMAAMNDYIPLLYFNI